MVFRVCRLDQLATPSTVLSQHIPIEHGGVKRRRERGGAIEGERERGGQKKREIEAGREKV